MVTVSAHVALELASEVSDVFGVMGNGNAWFLDAVLSHPGVAYTAVRHEASAVAAADAYFRSSNRVAVATATYGPGFTNALTPLAEAVQAHVPVIFVVGDAPSNGARAWDIDQSVLARGIGARTFRVTRSNAAGITRRALAYALGRQVPVVLSIPYDLADAEALPQGTSRRASTISGVESLAPDPAAIAKAVALLASAKRPALLAGRGAWLSRSAGTMRELAEKIDAVTATTALAINLFGDYERDLGVAGGFGAPAASHLLSQADVVLVVGASLNQFTMRFGDTFGRNAIVIQIDTAPTPTNPVVSHFVGGDALLSLQAIVEAMPQSGTRWTAEESAQIAAAKRDRHPGTALAPDGRLDPRSLATALNLLLPADRIVVQDGGHFIGWAPSYFDIPAPNRLIMVGTAFQTIGLGMASAVGAGRALPDSTIILCTGDGGGLMGLADLETVIRTVRRGVVIVFNDAAYGAEIHQYGVRGLNTRPMLIDEVNFAETAAALGAQSSVVRTLDDLASLERWLAAGQSGVYVVDCRVSQQIVAPYMAEWTK